MNKGSGSFIVLLVITPTTAKIKEGKKNVKTEKLVIVK